MPKKLTHEFVQEQFRIENYELLDKYINSRTKMSYKCSQHPTQELYISWDSFKQGQRCPFCTSPNRKTHEEFVSIVKNKNPNITIIGKYTIADAKIEVNCNICNHTWFPVAQALSRQKSTGCPLCSQSIIVTGKNDLWTTHPNIAKSLLNINDGYINSANSQKMVKWKCSNCNNIQSKTICNTINQQIFLCSCCKDGISFPERIMSNVLRLLNIDFNYNQMTDWSKPYKKKYDFYLTEENIIIETHGLQHYEELKWLSGKRRSLQEEKENDVFKQQLAIKNCIKKYIIIDCRISSIDFIKNSILNSDLHELYNLNQINWNDIEQMSLSNLINQAYDLWNEGLSVSTITTILKISPTTARRYLNQGASLNLCDYTPEKSLLRGNQKTGRSNAKKCFCITTQETFKSVEEASKKYSILKESIYNCCLGKSKSAGKNPQSGEKLVWKYLDKV